MFKKSIFLCLLVIVLAGCSERTLQVLTVEFTSGAVVPNVKVELIDVKKDKVIATKISDEEGQVVFDGLRYNREYMVSNVSMEESVIVDSERFTYEKDMAYLLFETHFPNNLRGLAVPTIEQPERMKSGEAVVALTSVLQYYGIEVTLEEVLSSLPQQPFIDNVIGGNPNAALIGDVYGDESYVLAKPIAEVAVTLAKQHDVLLSVFDASGSTEDELLQIVKSGVPVIAWVTKELAEPQNTVWQLQGQVETFSMARNVEPVVIIGHSRKQFHVISNATQKQYDEALFLERFTQLGAQAVVIRK
ncbi:MAG: C39 family peptidase [Caryophanon sp.]|nr:C39 family peptidase [Caryophanon sp.]